MKLTLITPVLAAILGLALTLAPVTVNAQTAPATTASTGTSTPKKAAKKSDTTSYAGSISAIDASSVTVTASKGDLKLAIDATTKFEVNKKKAAVTDFAVGDKVTGSYTTGADGSLTAHSLHKKAAK